ncbi:MAG: homocysteine S-methyltransferase family protein [Candidatus Thiodiazotropha sp. (ex Myrtea spinifera)]|nr:homocysteine S-methyltransferase family protein [Candidatus Thiodiazotropha sp. (ex Myrtea spinifera)]MCU7829464.1 homocysteine S-methyltransferase family protein [Candidatus Thiodiazotropha sp. (ex Myrtea sp. 'scaly one' KF741663)]
MKQLLQNNQLILMEAAIVEQLRRSTDIQLHDTLVNAPLIYHKEGQQALTRLYQGYIDIAREAKVPFLMCTPTWRANHSRVIDSGVSPSINSDAVQFMKNISKLTGNRESMIKIGGLIGCKNDCYMPSEGLSITESEDFHSWQINQLAEGGVDFLIAETLPNVEEAIGIAKAMERTGLPYIISFVIDRQGAVLDGTFLSDAVKQIDAATGDNPVAYMVNCAYPTFLNADRQPEELFSRLLGYLANASSLDHCDLDGSDNLESEKISEWGDAMHVLNRAYGISILGGCCGTGPAHLRYLVNH